MAAWSLSYLRFGKTWKADVDAALDEFTRILRPGGKIIIIESLGVGKETPSRPAALDPYMTYLDEKGFESKAIRTDYKFNDLDEAVELCRVFFGYFWIFPFFPWFMNGLNSVLTRPKKAKKVTANNWVLLPESTGVWWRTKPL